MRRVRTRVLRRIERAGRDARTRAARVAGLDLSCAALEQFARHFGADEAVRRAFAELDEERSRALEGVRVIGSELSLARAVLHPALVDPTAGYRVREWVGVVHADVYLSVRRGRVVGAHLVLRRDESSELSVRTVQLVAERLVGRPFRARDLRPGKSGSVDRRVGGRRARLVFDEGHLVEVRFGRSGR